jgi:hypothetical protein
MSQAPTYPQAIEQVPHLAARQALRDFYDGCAVQLRVLRALRAVAGVVSDSAPVVIVRDSRFDEIDDGRSDGTRYHCTLAVGIDGEEAPDMSDSFSRAGRGVCFYAFTDATDDGALANFFGGSYVRHSGSESAFHLWNKLPLVPATSVAYEEAVQNLRAAVDSRHLDAGILQAMAAS